MLLRKEKGWDTRLSNVCLSNQHTINTDLSSNSSIKSLIFLEQMWILLFVSYFGPFSCFV